MNKVLIDTNIYSLAMKGDDRVTGILRKIDLIGISAISIGELFSIDKHFEHIQGLIRIDDRGHKKHFER